MPYQQVFALDLDVFTLNLDVFTLVFVSQLRYLAPQLRKFRFIFSFHPADFGFQLGSPYINSHASIIQISSGIASVHEPSETSEFVILTVEYFCLFSIVFGRFCHFSTPRRFLAARITLHFAPALWETPRATLMPALLPD